MGLHTWFRKDREIEKKLKSIYAKIDDDMDHLSDAEIYILDKDAGDLYEQNDTEFHDLFRTSKLNANGMYPGDEIFSYEETLKWLEDNENKIYSFSNELKEQLKNFWNKYPNGVINFG